MAQQKLGRDIQGHPIEQIHDIKGLARWPKQTHHDLSPALEDIQIGDAILDEHGPDELPTGSPLLAIGGEDTIAQKRRPEIVKALALAKIRKIAGQHGLDMVRVAGKEIPHRAGDVALDAVGALRCGITKVVGEKFQKAILLVSSTSGQDNFQVCMS